MAPKSNLCKYIDVYVNLLSQNAFIGALLIALHSLFHLYYTHYTYMSDFPEGNAVAMNIFR